MGANRLSSVNSSDFETTSGGTWQWKWKWRWPKSHRLLGYPLIDVCTIDPARGELLPVIALVTDTENGGSFRSFRFEAFVAPHPELRHVRTRVKSLGQNASCERGFESLKYERLYLVKITDGPHAARHAEAYRVEYNTVRLHMVLGWNCPLGVHSGLADPATPNVAEAEILPTS